MVNLCKIASRPTASPDTARLGRAAVDRHLKVRERQASVSLGLPCRIRDEDCDIEPLTATDLENDSDEQQATNFGASEAEHIHYAIKMVEIAHLRMSRALLRFHALQRLMRIHAASWENHGHPICAWSRTARSGRGCGLEAATREVERELARRHAPWTRRWGVFGSDVSDTPGLQVSPLLDESIVGGSLTCFFLPVIFAFLCTATAGFATGTKRTRK